MRLRAPDAVFNSKVLMRCHTLSVVGRIGRHDSINQRLEIDGCRQRKFGSSASGNQIPKLTRGSVKVGEITCCDTDYNDTITRRESIDVEGCNTVEVPY